MSSALVTNAGLLLACAMIVTSGGYPHRIADKNAKLTNELKRRIMDPECFGSSRRYCQLGAEGEPQFLLWGDSHAEMINQVISKAASDKNIGGVFAGHGSCLPAIGVAKAKTEAQEVCRQFNREIAQDSARFKTIILAARWEDGHHSTDGKAIGLDLFEKGLDELLSRLGQAKVWIVAQAPPVPFNPANALAQTFLTGRPVASLVSRADYKREQGAILAILARVAAKHQATVLYPDRALCPNGTCEISVDGVPVYSDRHHLTLYGADMLSPLFKTVFNGSANQLSRPKR